MVHTQKRKCFTVALGRSHNSGQVGPWFVFILLRFVQVQVRMGHEVQPLIYITILRIMIIFQDVEYLFGITLKLTFYAKNHSERDTQFHDKLGSKWFYLFLM